MAPILAYWKCRGRAHPIRYLLHYVGQEYEEKLYMWGPAPDYDWSSWYNVKYKLDLDFPNLPYYIDGDVKLSQTGAILRYLAEKHNLVATKPEEKVRMLLIEYQMADMRDEFRQLVYSPDFEQIKHDYIKALPDKVKSLSAFLGQNKWISGEIITYVDFIIYEFFALLKTFKPDYLDAFKNLKDYVDRFEAIPAIDKYMKSDDFIKSPFLGPFAVWNN